MANEIWNPIPRFERINAGICPDCDASLTDSGNCLDCHITPSLDPEFQRWLSGTYTDARGNEIEITETVVKAATPAGFIGQGYTADQALSAARWYEEEAAKSYCSRDGRRRAGIRLKVLPPLDAANH